MTPNFFTYDDLYRLEQEQTVDAVLGNRTTSYTYDKVGNRKTQDENGVFTSYVYNLNDQVLSEGVNGGDLTTYTYDDNGNTLTKVVNATDTTTYTYDSRDRLLTMDDGAQFLEYEYDAMGIRQSKSVDGTKETYLVDTLQNYAQVIATLDDLGNAMATYTYGLDRVSQTIGANTTYYHFDGLGSTRLLSDASGVVTDAYTYKAFGEVEDRVGGTANDYLFTGEQYDANLGFYYLRARYYNPLNGRFHTLDTYQGNKLDPQSLHKYLYTHADPVNNVDPSGNIISVVQIGSILVLSGNHRMQDFRAKSYQGGQIYSKLRRNYIAPVRNLKRMKKNPSKHPMFNSPKAFKEEIHHLVEKRVLTYSKNLKKLFGRADDIPGVSISKETHRLFTNRWLKHLPRKNMKGFKEPSIGELMTIADKVYKGYPAYANATKNYLSLLL